tara:strand:+ start:229 stop:1014 length:786 start_codon:yes stop_codon:yes gene_type:complete
MPTFREKAYSTYFKRIFQISQTTNVGADATLRAVETGDGATTSISLSDDVLKVQPVNDSTTGTFLCNTSGGSSILSVDTTNSKVLLGASQVPPTLFKEMGIYDFSPTAGYHYPLIAHNMIVPTGATAFAGDNDWGDGTDPATTLDVSGLTAQENAIAVYWYLENDITLDSVRFIATADGSATLNFHLFGYDMDVSSNFGDLSGGTVHAHATVVATATTIKTGTFTLDNAEIDASKVVIGFVENVSDTSDVSVSLNLKYHIR